jgi:ribose 5-phosphate isomerase
MAVQRFPCCLTLELSGGEAVRLERDVRHYAGDIVTHALSAIKGMDGCRVREKHVE